MLDLSRKHDRATELRAIADGRLLLNVRNGVTVSRSMLAKIADEIDALRATVTPAEVGGLVAMNSPTAAPQQCGRDVEELTRWLRELADPMCEAMPERERLTQFVHAGNQAASLIQSQATRIAELEAGLEAIAVFPNPPTVSQARARALLNEDSTHD